MNEEWKPACDKTFLAEENKMSNGDWNIKWYQQINTWPQRCWNDKIDKREKRKIFILLYDQKFQNQFDNSGKDLDWSS